MIVNDCFKTCVSEWVSTYEHPLLPTSNEAYYEE